MLPYACRLVMIDYATILTLDNKYIPYNIERF